MRALIENEQANEYVRSAAMKGLLTLVATGQRTRDEVMEYFASLFGKLERTLPLDSMQEERTVRALRADIMYGAEEHVIHIERFDCDPAFAVEKDQSHKSICKPTITYQVPLEFVYGRKAAASSA